MTFLASACSKTLLKLQLGHYEFERNCIAFRINAMSRETLAIEDSYNVNGTIDKDALESDQVYRYLKQQSEFYSAHQEEISQQIELLNSEIASLQSLVQQGIKNSCGLTLTGS